MITASYLIRILFLLKIIFGLCLASNLIDRQLETFINPGCEELCNGSVSSIVYTKSTGANDVLHYLWSNIGAPASLIVLTNEKANLTVDWERLLNDTSDIAGAIHFDQEPEFVFGYVLSKLIEFDDESDTSVLGNSTVNVTPMEILQWNELESVDINSTGHVQATFSTLLNSSYLFKETGQLSIQMNVHGDNGHNEILPRLLYNSNSTEMRLTLSKLMPQLNNSRYGFEVITISSEKGNQNWTKTETDTINDENTPGVFKTLHIMSPAAESGFGSYMMWKPVAYTSSDLTVIESSDVRTNDFVVETDLNLPYSIAKAFFVKSSKYLINQFNVTFGTPGDGFYSKTDYNVWAFSSGIGFPLDETFSLLVIMIITSGLGLPLLLMIASTAYIFVNKYRRKEQAASVTSPLNSN